MSPPDSLGRGGGVAGDGPNGDDDRTWKLLLLEYERLQQIIGRFDGHRSTVRAWLVSAVTAVLVLGFQQRSVAISLGAPVVVILFGYLEVIYMSMEAATIARSNEVERLLERLRRHPSTSLDDYTFGVGPVFIGLRFRLRDVLRLIRHREHITHFYAWVLCVAGIAVVVGALRS